ncbi:MAG: tandem-95 repeat protein, partial [Planctomycetes bacterium]|nr:tandem-95 repeat protein [Planctomycetota bacterium]
LLRFNSNLTLDASFGVNGVVESNFGEGRHAYSVKLDREGRYLVGGIDFLARYLNNGQLDTSFGTNGKSTAGQTNPIYDIDIQADGKILTVGRDSSSYWVSRYLTNGTLEANWAYHENAYHHARGIQIDDTGDFLIAGRDGTDRLRVTRVNVSGIEEASFQYDLPGNEFYRSSLRLPDGKMLVIGESNGDVVVTRHLASGAIDTTFGSNGLRTFPGLNAGDVGCRASLQPDGKILITGESYNGVNQDILVARMSYDGVLDSTFNRTGVRVINLSGDDYGYGIISQPDGRIVIAGRSGNDIALVRLYGDYDVFGERPTFSPIADRVLDEDFGTHVVDLTGISPGGSSLRPLRVFATSSSPDLIPNPTVQYASPESTGSLILSSIANTFGSSVITVTVEDGGDDANLTTPADNRSLSRQFTVSVNGVNDQPTLSAIGLSPIYIEDAPASTLYRSANASTVEEGQGFTSLSLTVSNLTEASAEILIVNGVEIPLVAGSLTAGTINSFDVSVSVKVVNTTATVVISHMGLTKGELETLINALRYKNTSQNPTLGIRVVTISQLVDSGSNTNPNDNTNETLAIVSSVTVVPVNDAPLALNDLFSMNEDASLSVGGAGVKVNDSDPDHSLAVVNALIVTNPVNAASFSFRSDGTFNYRPNSNFSGQDTFTYKLNDGSLDSNIATVIISIVAVNDAPTINVPGPQTTNEDTPRKIPSITVGDVDATILAVTLAVTNGKIILGMTTGLTFTNGTNGASTFSITGTTANVNAGLASVTYSPNLNFNGSDTLVATVSDLGATGAGGVLAATGNIAITVNAVNDAPYDITLSASAVNENTSTATQLLVGTLSASDFDIGDTAAFSLLAGLDDPFFLVTGNQLLFKAGTVLDFETKPRYQCNIRVTDSSGATLDKVLNVSVVNLPEVSGIQVEEG